MDRSKREHELREQGRSHFQAKVQTEMESKIARWERRYPNMWVEGGDNDMLLIEFLVREELKYTKSPSKKITLKAWLERWEGVEQ